LFFTLAFYGPHLGPVLTLYGAGSLEERQSAATELLLLSETVVVAVPILFLGAVIFSLVLTRRVAGPLFRLDQSVQEWAAGNLQWRVRFRQSDRLDELADTANRALADIERAFGEVHRQQAVIQAMLATPSLDAPADRDRMRVASDTIAQTLSRFTYSSPR
jgi:methyl-accepting chemotaxis protein